MKTTLTTSCPRVVSEKLCAVYESETGKIFHFHAITNFEGSVEMSESEIQSRALSLARAARLSALPANLKTCLVDPETEKPGCAHRIDLQTLRLIATPAT